MKLATSCGRCACRTSWFPRTLWKRGPAPRINKSASHASRRLTKFPKEGALRGGLFLASSVPSGNDAIAGSLFAVSLFPYLAFLYYCFKTKQTPRLVSVGFATLLIFVFVTAPAGIYAQKVYGTSLSNVDWLHGSAESFLFFTNLLIVVALRRGIREAERSKGKSGKQT